MKFATRVVAFLRRSWRWPFGSRCDGRRSDDGPLVQPQESGRGYEIDLQGDTMIVTTYVYESSGDPIWYFSSGTYDHAPAYSRAPTTSSGTASASAVHTPRPSHRRCGSDHDQVPYEPDRDADLSRRLDRDRQVRSTVFRRAPKCSTANGRSAMKPAASSAATGSCSIRRTRIGERHSIRIRPRGRQRRRRRSASTIRIPRSADPGHGKARRSAFMIRRIRRSPRDRQR